MLFFPIRQMTMESQSMKKNNMKSNKYSNIYINYEEWTEVGNTNFIIVVQ